ncbi:MAG: enoyl-CoA hydratase-related protein [Pseudomonadota bacterium]
MTDLAFRVDLHDAVAQITFDRAEKRNALGLSFWEDFPDAIKELDDRGDIRAIVLASEGPVFCAGIDLAAFQAIAGDLAPTNPARGLDFLHKVHRMQRTFSALEEARIPIIAAIQGGCLGAGVDMVTACDIRVCTEDAYFSIYEIELGMTADVGTFPRILNHLPEGVVRELAYTGRKMPADEALRYGLVNQVLPDHPGAIEAAMTLAQEIAQKAPMAVHGCKRAITYARDHTTEETLDWIGLWNASMLQPTELMAAMAAKQTKTPGQFTPLPRRKSLKGE